jgi:hypothetical protein
VSGQEQHFKSAAVAYQIAEKLRSSDPAWSLVPLFYSAMHLVHGVLAERGSGDYYHPKLHWAVRDDHDQIARWGTMDVVVLELASISAAYRELHKVSELVRYKHLDSLGDASRYWGYFEEIRQFADLQV